MQLTSQQANQSPDWTINQKANQQTRQPTSTLTEDNMKWAHKMSFKVFRFSATYF